MYKPLHTPYFESGYRDLNTRPNWNVAGQEKCFSLAPNRFVY